MSTAVDYPLQERLRTLQNCYKEFYNNENAKILRWVLEADEFVMFDAFFDVEISVAASSPDLFLKFETPFESGNNYTENLYRELSQNVNDYLASTEEGKVEVNWIPLDYDRVKSKTSALFSDSLSDFGKGLPDLEDRVVALLAPANISNDNDFIGWLEQRLQGKWPENIRFMILDYIDEPRFGKLSTAFPEEVMTITPALEMSEAMKEVSAAAGKPDDPDTKFRAAFIDMTKAATKKRMKEVEQHANKAIAVCVAENWLHLHIGVLIAKGSAWMNQSDSEKALKDFVMAEKMAVSARNQGDDVAAALLSNVLFAKGAVYVQKKDWDSAANIYQQIPETTKGDHNKTMEAWRMTGFCYDQIGERKPARDAYAKALDAAEALGMNQEAARKSTLPYIGKALLRLNRPLINPESTQEISNRLEVLMGKGWD